MGAAMPDEQRLPAWVVPSRVSGSVMDGSGDIGDRVCGPAPGMANAMVSGPADAAPQLALGR